MLNTLRTRLQDRTAREGAYTMIEVLVVCLITSILAAIGYPMVLANQALGHDNSVRADLQNYSVAMAEYRVEGHTGSNGLKASASIHASAFKAVKHSEGNHFAVTSGQGSPYCIFGYSESGERTRANPIVITESNTSGTATCPLVRDPSALDWN